MVLRGILVFTKWQSLSKSGFSDMSESLFRTSAMDEKYSLSLAATFFKFVIFYQL